VYDTGVKCAGSIVLFNDADCIARPDFLVYCFERMHTDEGSDLLGTGVHAMCPFQSMINIAGATKQAFLSMPDFALLARVAHDERRRAPEIPLEEAARQIPLPELQALASKLSRFFD
jgi:hypothetical protein